VKQTLHFDDSEDRLIVHSEQDVEPIIDEVKSLKETSKEVPGLGYHAGRIPDVVVLDYMNTVGITFAEFINNPVHIKRIMTDPDYKKFRVWEGRL